MGRIIVYNVIYANSLTSRIRKKQVEITQSMSETSSFKQVTTLLPITRLVILGSLVLICLLAMIGVAFILNRQLVVSDQSTLARAEYKSVDNVALLEREHLLLIGVSITFVVLVLLAGYGVFQLIGERRRAEDALRASERRHRVLLDTIPDIVLRRKRDGTYTDFKPAKEFGIFMPRSAFIGKNVTEILPPPVAQASMEASELALATGEEQIHEYQLPDRQTGALHDYEARVLPSGEDEVQVIVRDVTDEKLQEGRLHQAQKLESLGVLAGGIAHDFNNLLTGMLAQSSLARLKLERGLPAFEHIDKAVVSAERAADLTRQLLAYAGKGKFQLISLDLNQLIYETSSLIETALPNRTELQLELGDPLLLLEADRGQIQQVVMNLVINAAEALPDGGGYVRITTASQIITAVDDSNIYMGANLPPGHYVALQVCDNGTGMDPKTLSRIFDPFFSTKVQGHGLGLAATLGIIRTHHGGIHVQSQPGVGTKFTLLFPAAAVQSVATVDNNMTLTPEHDPKQLVLVIDDEPSIREVVTDILVTEGLSVIVAASGQEGIERFRQQRSQIGLVLLDMKMPGLSGEETFRVLHQIDPMVKVILSSGYNETEVHRHFGESSIVGFLQKPYTLALLMQSVHAALTNHLMPVVTVLTETAASLYP
jgi:PAS domain S-box-containing protein